MAKQLRELGWVPDVVICSNALRTRQTYDVLRDEIPELADADAHFLGSLYTVAALDGQTRAHLQVTEPCQGTVRAVWASTTGGCRAGWAGRPDMCFAWRGVLACTKEMAAPGG